MSITERKSVFEPFVLQAWPYRYEGALLVSTLAGGTPSDPNVAEGWIKSKTMGKQELVRDEVMRVMAERQMTLEQATAEVDRLKHLNGFKHTPDGQLMIEGRQLKAGLKEAASVARASDKLPDRWGTTRKGITGFVAEHIQVVEERLPLFTQDGQPIMEPDDVQQSFPKNSRTGQTGIQYTEICRGVVIPFTIICDWNFTPEEWAILWLTAEQQGIGATRSQGMGRYEVIQWDQVSAPAPKRRTAKTAAAPVDDTEQDA